MRKKYFGILLGAVFVLGFGLLVQASSTTGPPVTFSSEGGTEDLGVTTYVMVPRTWTVNIPSNFTKVEMAHYDKPTPDTIKKYMGWNGYSKVNDSYVWKFLSWSSETGGLIYDYAQDQQVAESSGSGLWLDATSFFQAGANTVKYYHYTGGGGIGLKIRVTTGEEALKPDGEACDSASECEGGHCVNSYCRATATYCGDEVCDTGEDCSSCSADCGICPQPNGSACSNADECESGYCVHEVCRSGATYCGDGECDSPETCSSCDADCGECVPEKPTTLTFTEDATKDGGVVHYSEGGYTWTVNLPSNFVKVEIAHYDKPTPDTIKKYMGWNGYVQANNSYVWKFLSWSSGTGGVIHDYVVDEQVYESTGVNKWIDATEFFYEGTNTVKYYHYTEGDGIGLKVRVTTGVPKKADGEACTAASVCVGGHCVNGYCRSSATHCGDEVCDSGEDCSACSSDCGVCEVPKKDDGASCEAASECDGGYCVNDYCRATATHCGDGVCDMGEDCSGCPDECGLCEGRVCSYGLECESGYCVNGYCRLSSIYCGDSVCDTGEDYTNCSNDCAEPKKDDGASCEAASECDGSYCVNDYCRSTATYCGDNVCDTGEDYTSCSDDCDAPKKNDGYSCTAPSQCKGGFCVNHRCQSAATFCGDMYCDSPENCSTCDEDCGKCDSASCSSDYECASEHCVDGRCSASAAYCGDGVCQVSEDCSSCNIDCACASWQCCSTASTGANDMGCVSSGRDIDNNSMCCSGTERDGECCNDSDCADDKICMDNQCITEAVCGDWVCEPDRGENCSNCAEDCGCLGSECCYAVSDSADTKGCVKTTTKVSDTSVCCGGETHFGDCCGDEQCSRSEKCKNNLCGILLECGDGICSPGMGENCSSCVEDCREENSGCCSPGSSLADEKGYISSGEKVGNTEICCFDNLRQGDCCSSADCADKNEKCIDFECKVPQAVCGDGKCEPKKGESCDTCWKDCGCAGDKCCSVSSKNKDVNGCVAAGKETAKGEICCGGNSYRGDCCRDSACGSDARCLSHHCTKFIDQFYKYYFRDKANYNGKLVPHSDMYKAIAYFYKEQAVQLDVPVMAFGKFVKALDALSDTTRSLISLNFVGLAMNTYKFLQELETWEITGGDEFQNNVMYWYSASSLVFEGSGAGNAIQPAVAQLASKLPANRVLSNISARHNVLKQQISKQASAKTLFAFEIADFIMDATLIKEVNDNLRYDVFDYTQKIQLSLLARELGWLWEKAEGYNITDQQAFVLMALEREFWMGVYIREANRIGFEYVKRNNWTTRLTNFLGANSEVRVEAAEATRRSAENWLMGLKLRRDALFRIYYALLQKEAENWAKGLSPWRSLIGSFVPSF